MAKKKAEGYSAQGLEDWFIHVGGVSIDSGKLWDMYIDAFPDEPLPRSQFDGFVSEMKAACRPKNKGGHPSSFSQSTVDYICQELSKGIPLTAICRGDAILSEKVDPENDIHERPERMPAPRTVRDWEAERPEVAAAIARARENCEHALFEECLTIADDGRRDYVMTDAGPSINHDHIQRTKIRIETRLKLLAKINPKRYGDKVQHSNDPENPFQPATFIMQPVAPPSRED